MRKLFVILSIVFTLLGTVFSFLPLGTIAFLPIGLAIIMCLLALKNSEADEKRTPKSLLMICAICSAFVLGKTTLIKDKVVKDEKFEEQKIEAKKEAKKELEELEKELE